ncbi:MAG TPA: ShlB/FhaC/HecB family hemolysin secretion/activation protein [Gallionellaceae bacterium]
MESSFNRRRAVMQPSCLVISLLLIFSAANATAQTAPNAGQLLQQQPKPPAVAPAKPATISPEAPEAAPTVQGPKVLVKGFRIKGAVLIPESELVAQLQPAIGKELTLDQLRATAMLLTAYYAEKGYLARAILPPQDIKDGIVEIQVIEGKRGNLNLNKEGERINAARAQDFIDRRLPEGAPMNFAQLGEALNILNEQPGVAAKADLKPGKNEGEIGLDVKVTEQPLITYSAGLNNHGSYGTGEIQANGSITLNNPTGHFDAASLLLNESQGSNYARVDYSAAAGDSGLRLGGYASYLDYHLIPSSFSALQPKGRASTAGLAASYPWARRTDFNLSLTSSYDDSTLVDSTVAGETSNRHVGAFNLGMNGYTISTRLGGVASFGANFVSGNTDQLNATALATDNTTRQVQGSFNKIGYNFGWLSSLPHDWKLNATLRGQIAGKNLDTSQQLILGGPNGVRAYPVGEAAGDDGWLFNFDFGTQLGDQLTGHLFYDLGGITLNHTLWANWNAGNPALPNTYTLSGVGAGMDWRINPAFLFTASIATPLGTNPGEDANHHNVDGYGNQARAWLSLNARF